MKERKKERVRERERYFLSASTFLTTKRHDHYLPTCEVLLLLLMVFLFVYIKAWTSNLFKAAVLKI